MHLQALEEVDLDGKLDKEVWDLRRRGTNTANNLPVSALSGTYSLCGCCCLHLKIQQYFVIAV